MIRDALVLATVLALFPAAHAQTGGKKADSGEVEMTFANGSVVRMALVPDEIEVVTQFGKLMVPVREIRRIDFGLHLPDGADKKIASAVKKLSSADYKERETALRELVALGAHAFPALLQAAKSTELEAAKRAQDALAQIKAKVPAKDLRLGDEDKIVTPRFTIVGRIVTPALKAKSEYFGETEHALVNLRQLRLLVESRDTEVVVDAAKFALSGQWLDTGIVLDSSANLAILASGEVELRPTLPGTYVCGPRGYSRFAAAGPFGKGKKAGMDGPTRVYPGTLLGRIGEKGETFVIGDHFEGGPESEGKLYLQIMPSTYDGNAVGTYQVRIMVRD